MPSSSTFSTSRLGTPWTLPPGMRAARVTRYALAPQGDDGAAPRFECDDCHRQFRLSQGSAKVQIALKQVLQALATAGHESLAVDIAVHGRCADCAHPAGGAAA